MGLLVPSNLTVVRNADGSIQRTELVIKTKKYTNTITRNADGSIQKTTLTVGPA